MVFVPKQMRASMVSIKKLAGSSSVIPRRPEVSGRSKRGRVIVVVLIFIKVLCISKY
jgi:hypothetical protein